MIYELSDSVKINYTKSFMLNDNNEFESVDKSQNIQGAFNEIDLYFEDEGLCEFEEVFNLLLETTTEKMNVDIPEPTFVRGEYNIAFSAFPVQTKALGKIATILVFIGGVQVDDETAILFCVKRFSGAL